jgi:Tfp pilus assembly protein FimT
MELLIAMAILGILGVIATPLFRDWMHNARYREAASDIASTYGDARGKAIAANREHRVILQMTQKKYQIDRGNQSFNATTWTTDLSASDLPGDTTLRYDSNNDGTCNSTADLNLYFYPDGTVSPDPFPDVCIFDAAGAEKYRVQIPFASTGRVVVAK